MKKLLLLLLVAFTLGAFVPEVVAASWSPAAAKTTAKKKKKKHRRHRHKKHRKHRQRHRTLAFAPAILPGNAV